VFDQVIRQRQAVGKPPSQRTQTDDLLSRLVNVCCADGGPDRFDDDWIRRYTTGLAATAGGATVRAERHAIDRLLADFSGLREARELAAKLESGCDANAELRLRIIRRGGIYGDLMSAAEGEAAGRPDDSRGLNFICLNARHRRSVRHGAALMAQQVAFWWPASWTDTISHYPDRGTTMTVQHRPANIRISVPQCVRVAAVPISSFPALRRCARLRFEL